MDPAYDSGTYLDYGPDSHIQGEGVPSGSAHRENTPQIQSPRAYENGTEEKKDDGYQSKVQKEGSLKTKFRQWGSKSMVETTKKDTSHLETSLEEVELLTPDMVEQRRQEKRRSRLEELRSSGETPLSSDMLKRPSTEKQVSASGQRLNECVDQRNSFASLRERLKPSSVRADSKAKSDVGAGSRSSIAADVVDRLRRESPTSGPSSTPSSNRDTQSDSGSTPSFLANVKLRKTPSSKRLTDKNEGDSSADRGQTVDTDDYTSPETSGRPLSYRERRALEQQAYEEPEDFDVEDTRQEPSPVKERKLTYRERREMELKREQENKVEIEAAKEPPKMDVAALIRKRIAANKQKSVTSQVDETPETVSPFRGRLKHVNKVEPVQKVSSAIPSPIQTESPQGLQQIGSIENSPRHMVSTSDESSSEFGQQPRLQSPRFGSQQSPRFGSQQSPKYGSQQSPRFGSQQSPKHGSQHSRQSQHSQPSPRFFTENALIPVSSDVHNEEPGDQALCDALSPSSAGTEMEYSTGTDNSRSLASNYGAPKQSPGYHSPKKSPRHLLHSENKNSEPQASTNHPQRFFEGNQTGARGLSPDQHLASPRAAAVDKSSDQGEFFAEEEPKKDVKSMLSNFLGGRPNPSSSLPAPSKEDDAQALMRSKKHLGERDHGETGFNIISPRNDEEESPPPPPPPAASSSGTRPALKDDPKYERYFRMLKVGMPMEVVKHAISKDGNDPSVMDGDHNKPVGLPLKEDPKYQKYFKMLNMGVLMGQVKHAMERDGLMPEIMDQDHGLPAMSCEMRSRKEPKEKATHRLARLHWKTVQKVCRNSLWAKIETDPELNKIDIDEDEFNELFKADLTPSLNSPRGLGSNRKKGAAVRVIDAKRANNGGIILARVKMTHDEMADAVDRMYVEYSRFNCHIQSAL
jgi:hypothetical protein